MAGRKTCQRPTESWRRSSSIPGNCSRPCAFASRAGLPPGEFPADRGDAVIDQALIPDKPVGKADQARGTACAPWLRSHLSDGRGRNPAGRHRCHPRSDQHPARAFTGGNVHMSGAMAKSAIFNAEDRKIMSCAWSNDVSGCQNSRLHGAMCENLASRATCRRKTACRTVLGSFTFTTVFQMGNAG